MADDSPKRRSNQSGLRIGCCLVLVLALSVAMLLSIPPWQNRFAWVVHSWLWKATGIELHTLENYTGQVRSWDSEGRLRYEQSLLDGRPHGRWIEYNEDGTVVRVSEYRNGAPWDGVCHIFHQKAFLGEYKAGRPWNGYLPTGANGQRWHCYIDGVEVSEHEYRQRKGIEPDATLIGLGYIEP